MGYGSLENIKHDFLKILSPLTNTTLQHLKEQEFLAVFSSVFLPSNEELESIFRYFLK